ncbi:MAG: phosphotransferase [Pseudomonadota bacterium]
MTITDDQLWRVFELVRTQRWFAQKHLKASRVSVCDTVSFECSDKASYTWLLLRVEPDDTVYSIVIKRGSDNAPVLASPRSLVEYVSRHGSVATNQGGAILSSGGLEELDAAKMVPLEPCNSSNSLYSADLAETVCVAKFYRKMDAAGQRERRTLSAMHASGLTPRLYGAIEYHAPNRSEGHEPEILCLFLEKVHGRPAYEPFQDAARTAIARLASGRGLSSVLSDHDVNLPQECATLGRLIADFHSAAGSVMPAAIAAQPFELAASIDALERRWARLAPMVRQSSIASDLSCLSPMSALADIRTFETQSLTASYSHGDLHLSHIIFEQGHGYGRIIDPAHGVGEPHMTDNSARDLLQICRGFECFIFDEVATYLAASLAKSRDDAGAFLADPKNTHAAQWMRFAQRWSHAVFAKVLKAYVSAVPLELAQPVSDPAWRSVFYLERLLHELEYNIAYDRAFFLSSDIAFLRNFNSRAAALLPRTAAALRPQSAAECRSDKEDAHVVH